MIDPITQYILEQQSTNEGWQDIAGAVAKGALKTAGNIGKRKGLVTRIQKTKMKISVLKKSAANCPKDKNPKTCKAKHFIKMGFLNNGLAQDQKELRQMS